MLHLYFILSCCSFFCTIKTVIFGRLFAYIIRGSSRLLVCVLQGISINQMQQKRNNNGVLLQLFPRSDWYSEWLSRDSVCIPVRGRDCSAWCSRTKFPHSMCWINPLLVFLMWLKMHEILNKKLIYIWYFRRINLSEISKIMMCLFS